MNSEKITDMAALEAKQRAHNAKLDEELKKRKESVTEKESWIEIVRKASDKPGRSKVIRKVITSSGHTHSLYVGVESKCLDYLLGEIKKGVPVYNGDRKWKALYEHPSLKKK